ncbi:MAG TPA: glycosyltransferase, partial [Cytophagaceae bacterium]
MKTIIVTVTTDLVTDQRVHKVSQSLHKSGYKVLLVGRKKKDSLPLAQRDYDTKRFKLFFEKTALFYINYNLRLFLFLLFTKADILLANDLDTLLPVFLVSKLKGIPIIYDNHEYFTATPELTGRPVVTYIWKSIERFIFPKLSFVYTVNDSIKNLFEDEYGVKVEVIRNIPIKNLQPASYDLPIDLPDDKKIIIYQGSGINKDRGAEELVESIQYLENILLLIVGSGDVINV